MSLLTTVDGMAGLSTRYWHGSLPVDRRISLSLFTATYPFRAAFFPCCAGSPILFPAERILRDEFALLSRAFRRLRISSMAKKLGVTESEAVAGNLPPHYPFLVSFLVWHTRPIIKPALPSLPVTSLPSSYPLRQAARQAGWKVEEGKGEVEPSPSLPSSGESIGKDRKGLPFLGGGMAPLREDNDARYVIFRKPYLTFPPIISLFLTPHRFARAGATYEVYLLLRGRECHLLCGLRVGLEA